MPTRTSSFSPGRVIVRSLIVILFLLVVLVIGLWLSIQPRPNKNALAIGPKAGAAVADPVEIKLYAPVEFDYMTREEVLGLRTDAANRYPGLLAEPYTPSDVVFKQIVDNRPWWGVSGQFYYGSGEKSIVGPAEEARFIMNPYLLAAADFYGLGNWPVYAVQNGARITEKDLARSDFPYYCRPEKLRWWPHAARGEVTYNLTNHLARINQWARGAYTAGNATFDVIAYNARDLNLNWVRLVSDESHNIQLWMPFDAPIEEPEYIHLGGSCGYPGGCNNASPDVPQFNRVGITGLPAHLTIHLWKNRPASAEQTPDMVFVLRFK